MVNKDKICKHCKLPYKDHIDYIMDAWDDEYEKRLESYDGKRKDICNMFKPMSNLELLEWEDEKRGK